MDAKTIEFIARAILVHGQKYTYESVEFVFNHVNVVVTCPLHGRFLQKPRAHLEGRGCKVCGKAGSIPHNQRQKEEAAARRATAKEAEERALARLRDPLSFTSWNGL